MIARPITVLKSLVLALALASLALVSSLHPAPGMAAHTAPEADGPPEAAPEARDRESSAASGTLLSCGSAAHDNWSTSSSSYGVIEECELVIPGSGWAYISANAMLSYDAAEYTGEFDIGIVGTSSSVDARRWVHVHSGLGSGTQEAVAVSVLTQVDPGSNTFQFEGRRSAGSGKVTLNYPSLSVIYIPDTDSDILSCGALDFNWTSSTSAYQTIHHCSLTLPEDGWVFMSADANVSWSTGGYEAEFDLDIDGTSGDGDARRWVDVYQETTMAPESTVAISILKPVSAGNHTFRFLGRRYDGGGQVNLYYPTLNVIYIPESSSMATTCGQSGSTLWTTTSETEAQTIWQCSLSLPEDTWAFVSASGSLGIVDDAYRARFGIHTDGTGFRQLERWLRVYTNAADGTDRSLAASMLVPVQAGERIFRFWGLLDTGGTVGLTDPTLSVIVPKDPTSTLDPPTLAGPVDGVTSCDARPTFSWYSVNGATSYRLQVDDSSSFGSPAINTTTSSTSYAPSSDLADDTYYWRVQALSATKESTWSEVREVTVLSRPSVPTLSTPANHSQLCDATPTFRWQSVDTATEYLFELDDDISFSSLVDDDALSDTYFTPGQALDPGEYFWRVQASNYCGVSAWSEIWDLTVGAPGAAPSLLRPADGEEVCEKKPGFQWASLDGASAYKLEVDDNAGFASPEVRKTTSDPYYWLTTELAPGAYYWRVQASFDCGDSPWSSARKVIVVHKLETPSLIAPPDGTTTSDQTPTLRWSSVKHAAEYRWELANDAGFVGLKRSGSVSGTSRTLDQPVEPGSYYWRVRAQVPADQCDSSDWSAAWRLNISVLDHQIYLPLVVR